MHARDAAAAGSGHLVDRKAASLSLITGDAGAGGLHDRQSHRAADHEGFARHMTEVGEGDLAAIDEISHATTRSALSSHAIRAHGEQAAGGQRGSRRSEVKFRTCVGNIPGVFYRCANDAAYTMEFISPAQFRMPRRYPASDFIGNERAHLRQHHSTPTTLDLVNKAVEDGLNLRQAYVIEYRVVHRDGSIRWAREYGQGIFGASGRAAASRRRRLRRDGRRRWGRAAPGARIRPRRRWTNSRARSGWRRSDRSAGNGQPRAAQSAGGDPQFHGAHQAADGRQGVGRGARRGPGRARISRVATASSATSWNSLASATSTGRRRLSMAGSRRCWSIR